ncbi:MAG: hypothetical protein ABIA02_00780 [Candidatus Falkowbacteria bacterium]
MKNEYEYFLDELRDIQRHRKWYLFGINRIKEKDRMAHFMLSKKTQYLGWLIKDDLEEDIQQEIRLMSDIFKKMAKEFLDKIKNKKYDS